MLEAEAQKLKCSELEEALILYKHDQEASKQEMINEIAKEKLIVLAAEIQHLETKKNLEQTIGILDRQIISLRCQLADSATKLHESSIIDGNNLQISAFDQLAKDFEAEKLVFEHKISENQAEKVQFETIIKGKDLEIERFLAGEKLLHCEIEQFISTIAEAQENDRRESQSYFDSRKKEIEHLENKLEERSDSHVELEYERLSQEETITFLKEQIASLEDKYQTLLAASLRSSVEGLVITIPALSSIGTEESDYDHDAKYKTLKQSYDLAIEQNSSLQMLLSQMEEAFEEQQKEQFSDNIPELHAQLDQLKQQLAFKTEALDDALNITPKIGKSIDELYFGNESERFEKLQNDLEVAIGRNRYLQMLVTGLESSTDLLEIPDADLLLKRTSSPSGQIREFINDLETKLELKSQSHSELETKILSLEETLFFEKSRVSHDIKIQSSKTDTEQSHDNDGLEYTKLKDLYTVATSQIDYLKMILAGIDDVPATKALEETVKSLRVQIKSQGSILEGFKNLEAENLRLQTELADRKDWSRQKEIKESKIEEPMEILGHKSQNYVTEIALVSSPEPTARQDITSNSIVKSLRISPTTVLQDIFYGLLNIRDLRTMTISKNDYHNIHFGYTISRCCIACLYIVLTRFLSLLYYLLAENAFKPHVFTLFVALLVIRQVNAQDQIH